MRKLVVLVLVTLGLLLVTPAVASASTPTLGSLAKAVAALQKQVNTQKSEIKTLSAKLARADSVLALAPYVKLDRSAINGVKGPNIIFHSVNLQIRSKSGQVDGSGLGNLVVGWDITPYELPSPFRTGSNNLVVGASNNFTSSGCFVAGTDNTASGSYATVSGGNGNKASGPLTTVSGGDSNVASGDTAHVSAGVDNTADGAFASVSGGSVNQASGGGSSVFGGHLNHAVSPGATIGGGVSITLNNSTQTDAWQAGPDLMWPMP
jgi:hypothetical protein